MYKKRVKFYSIFHPSRKTRRVAQFSGKKIMPTYAVCIIYKYIANIFSLTSELTLYSDPRHHD